MSWDLPEATRVVRKQNQLHRKLEAAWERLPKGRTWHICERLGDGRRKLHGSTFEPVGNKALLRARERFGDRGETHAEPDDWDTQFTWYVRNVPGTYCSFQYLEDYERFGYSVTTDGVHQEEQW